MRLLCVLTPSTFKYFSVFSAQIFGKSFVYLFCSSLSLHLWRGWCCCCVRHTQWLSCSAVIGIPVSHMLGGGTTGASLARLTGSVYMESAKTMATCSLRFCRQQNIHCSSMISQLKLWSMDMCIEPMVMLDVWICRSKGWKKHILQNNLK